MTCEHPRIARESLNGLSPVACLQCGHRWKECHGALEDEDYTVWLELSSPDWEEDTEDT